MVKMIEFTKERKQIILLWQSVFGDSIEDIEFFLDNCNHKSCIGYFVDDKLVSMAFLIDCSYASWKGQYIYAVGTDRSYRKKGFASLIIQEAKKHMSDFLWLIPAEDYLFDYYSRFGFETKLYSGTSFAHEIKFNENKAIIDYLYEGSTYKYPKGMIYSKKNLPCGSTGIKYKED